MIQPDEFYETLILVRREYSPTLINDIVGNIKSHGDQFFLIKKLINIATPTYAAYKVGNTKSHFEPYLFVRNALIAIDNRIRQYEEQKANLKPAARTAFYAQAQNMPHSLSGKKVDMLILDDTDFTVLTTEQKHVWGRALFHSFTKPQETKTMLIEKLILVNKRELKAYTNDELYALIAKTEGEVKQLKLIDNKPTSLVEHIESQEAAIKELIGLMDAR